MTDINVVPAFLSMPVDFNEKSHSNLAEWLIQQPSVGKTAWLLAYLHDGVTWGVIQDGKLITAADVFNTEYPGSFSALGIERLLNLSLFGEKAEIRLFQKDGIWCTRRIEENPAASQEDSYLRSYILWGNKVKAHKDNWSWMEDGQLGIHQAIPLNIPENCSKRIAYLDVRYYVDYENDHGQARIAAKRLVKLYTVEEG